MCAPERVRVLPNDLVAVERFVEDRASQKWGTGA